MKMVRMTAEEAQRVSDEAPADLMVPPSTRSHRRAVHSLFKGNSRRAAIVVAQPPRKPSMAMW